MIMRRAMWLIQCGMKCIRCGQNMLPRDRQRGQMFSKIVTWKCELVRSRLAMMLLKKCVSSLLGVDVMNSIVPSTCSIGLIPSSYASSSMKPHSSIRIQSAPSPRSALL